MSQFNLKQFLIENRLTTNSRILSEKIQFVDRDDAMNVSKKNQEKKKQSYKDYIRRGKEMDYYSDAAKRLYKDPDDFVEPDDFPVASSGPDIGFDPEDKEEFDFDFKELQRMAKGSWPIFQEAMNIYFLDNSPTEPKGEGMDRYPNFTSWLKDLITEYVKYMVGYRDLPKDISHYVELIDPDPDFTPGQDDSEKKPLTLGEKKLAFTRALFRVAKEHSGRKLENAFKKYGAKGILVYIHGRIATIKDEFQQDLFKGGHTVDDPSKRPAKYRGKKSSRRPYAKVSPGQVSLTDKDPNFGKSTRKPYQDRPYERGDIILYDPSNGDIINWTTGEIINVPESPNKKPTIRADKKGRIIDYSTGKVIGNIKRTIKYYTSPRMHGKHGSFATDPGEIPKSAKAPKFKSTVTSEPEKKQPKKKTNDDFDDLEDLYDFLDDIKKNRHKQTEPDTSNVQRKTSYYDHDDEVPF